MTLWRLRLDYCRLLYSLGFFRAYTDPVEFGTFNNFLAVKTNKISCYFMSKVLIGVYHILPLIISILATKNCFLFIDIKETNSNFLSNYYKIMELITSFIIYDWAYGVLSNFFVMHLEVYSYNTNKLPSLVFLLALYSEQKFICNEVSKKGLLGVALIVSESPSHIDYPIFINPLIEYNSIFFQVVLKMIKINWYDKTDHI